MRELFAALLCAGVATAAGCTSIFHGPDRAPTAQELTGVCDWGHRGSAETLELHTDGTFSRTLHEHLGAPSTIFTGTWVLQGNQLTLRETSRDAGDAEMILAEVFFYKRKPAFARRKDIESEKVHEWWVCKRRESDEA